MKSWFSVFIAVKYRVINNKRDYERYSYLVKRMIHAKLHWDAKVNDERAAERSASCAKNLKKDIALLEQTMYEINETNHLINTLPRRYRNLINKRYCPLKFSCNIIEFCKKVLVYYCN